MFKAPRGPLILDQLDDFLSELEQLDVAVSAGVVVEGHPAGYALVWEWGSGPPGPNRPRARQYKEGPKTVLGVNPNGERVFLTLQAPFGYVRIWNKEFDLIIEQELEAVDFLAHPKQLKKKLERCAKRIGEKMTALIKKSVPIDEGHLYQAISVRVAGIREFDDDDF